MSIASSIATLYEAKDNIADAITAKGVTLDASDGFADFAAAIAAIQPPSNYGLITFTAVDAAAANIMVS